MTQNIPVQTPQIITARARIWRRGSKWLLGIVDTEARNVLQPYINRRVVVEVLPAVYVEGLLRLDMGYPTLTLPARLRQTWQLLWVGKRTSKPELVERIYIPQVEKPAEGGGA